MVSGISIPRVERMLAILLLAYPFLILAWSGITAWRYNDIPALWSPLPLGPIAGLFAGVLALRHQYVGYLGGALLILLESFTYFPDVILTPSLKIIGGTVAFPFGSTSTLAFNIFGLTLFIFAAITIALYIRPSSLAGPGTAQR